MSEVLSSLLASSSCLIVDDQLGSRTRLFDALVGLGLAVDRIRLAGTIEEAKEVIQNVKPKLIFTEYNLGGESFLGLKDECPESIFIVVSAHNAAAEMAWAIENGVHAVVYKPFRIEALKSALLLATKGMKKESEYELKLAQGVEQLKTGLVDTSLKTFNQAKDLSAQPVWAFYWAAQAFLSKSDPESALKEYWGGLQFYRIHFKTLVGALDVCHQLKKWDVGYDICRRLVQYYPFHAVRLKTALKLAIQTENIDDIDEYLKVYLCLKAEDHDLYKHMNSALIVCARNYFTRGIPEKAYGYCDRVFEIFGSASNGKTHFLRYVIDLICEYGYFEKAKECLPRFPKEYQQGEDFLTCEYLVKSGELGVRKTIDMGHGLLKSGIHNALIYSSLIEGLILDNKKQSAAKLLGAAITRFPAHRDRFDQLRTFLESSNTP